MQNSCVIIGGGVVGIIAAQILAKKYKKVHIIEKSKNIGGLLLSKNYGRDTFFDYGPHIFTLTKIDDLNKKLFGSIEKLEKNWLIHDQLFDGNFFLKWNYNSPLIDIRNLPQRLYDESINQLNEIKFLSQVDDYNSYILENFGHTLKKNVFDKVVKKIYGNVDYDDLSIKSLKIFGLQRIIAFTSDLTLSLKKKSIYDERIAYHSFGQDRRNIKYFYPKGIGGIGQWVQDQTRILKQNNVTIHSSQKIDKIVSEKGMIKSIILEDSKSLDVDFCLWTIPPALGLSAGNIKFEGNIPKTRSNLIFHLEFDKPLKNKSSTYLWNWDPDFRVFRVTLYPNMKKIIENNSSYLTVEVLCDFEEARSINVSQIIDELKKLDIVPNDSEVIFNKSELLPSTIPILTKDYEKQTFKLNSLLEDSYRNLKTAGRYSGRAWFMNDTLVDLYQILS